MKNENKILIASDLMPKDAYATYILNKRANILSKKSIDTSIVKEKVEYLRFRLGAVEQYGIPFQYAREVMQRCVITKIPHVPEYVAGIINHRGILLTIIELARFFNLPNYNRSTEISLDINKVILIVENEGVRVGLLVDAVLDSDQYDTNELDKPIMMGGNVIPDYFMGISHAQTTLINVPFVISEIQSKLSAKIKEKQ